jgi:hypothetical protein
MENRQGRQCHIGLNSTFWFHEQRKFFWSCTQKLYFFSDMLFQIGVAEGRKGKYERGNIFRTQVTRLWTTSDCLSFYSGYLSVTKHTSAKQGKTMAIHELFKQAETKLQQNQRQSGKNLQSN